MTVRHDMIACKAYRRATLAIAVGRWAATTRQLTSLNGIAYAVLGNCTEALLRAVLRDWHLQTTRRLHKQRTVGAAVMHAWRLYTPLSTQSRSRGRAAPRACGPRRRRTCGAHTRR